MNIECGLFLLTVAIFVALGGCSTSRDRQAMPGTSAVTMQSGKPELSTEGMWLPNALPDARMEKIFGFRPTKEWAEHLRLSSVRIGASGSFVSADGLVLTNHHVAANGLHHISREGKDYLANGYLAKTRDEEQPLPGAELTVLVSIEDVTARVNAAVDTKLSTEESIKSRHAAIADIERKSLESTGLQSNVVTLYGGALYHLYRNKRYTDVRAVFAPEIGSAFFGGDTDNFEYPRFDLDITLLRAYENGKPAHVENYLHLAKQGVVEGEPVFVSGHPGHTDRLLPVTVLEGMRDVSLPVRIEQMERMEKALFAFAAKSPEAARRAEENIFGIQNGLKATRPRLEALRGKTIEEKRKDEALLRARLRQTDGLKQLDSAWDRVAKAEQQRARLQARMMFLEEGRAFGTGLFYDARLLVRLAAEDAKPDAQRLPEYTQSKRGPLEHGLFAEDPVYADLETAKLAASLELFIEKLGADSTDVKKVLEGKTSAARAEELVNGTKLGDPAERRRIREGGAAAIAASTDPFIKLARLIDEDARSVRKEYEAAVTEPQTQALTDINKARFALLGTDAYPDATGTLRLAYGFVKGYEQDGHRIEPWTTIGGAFAHEQAHPGQKDYTLPASWAKAKASLNAGTPLNFVCTADITGGNSGSPVVNRAGEWVGIIFDSNRQGVADNFSYTDDQARAVAVDCRGILEAMRKIYGAEELAKELEGK